MNKAVLVRADDWEGLFVNEELVQEGHTLNEGSSRIKYFVELSNKYRFKLEEMEEFYVADEYEEYLYDYGNFPKSLSDVKFQ